VNLVWLEFERRFRGLYRAELKARPALRKEVKQKRKSDARALPHLTRRALLPLFWCSIFLSVAGKQSDLEFPAAALALWAAGAAFRWGHHWFQQFYASEDLVVLNFLPLRDAQIFRFQLRRYLASAGWLFWELSLAYLVLAFVEGASSPPMYQLLIAGVLQAVLVVALALHLASWAHMLPLGIVGVLLRLTAIAVLIFGTQRPGDTFYFAQSTEWFLPTGWVNYALFRGTADHVVYTLLVPIFALIYLARYSFDRLRSFYSLAGVEIVPARGVSPANDEELTGENAGPRPGPTEIEDRLLGRTFLEGLNWQISGALEKFIARCLSERERVITEFLVAGNPGWTHGLKVSFWIWVATCTVVLALGQFGGTIIFFAAYILATTSLPLFGGQWRGMRQSASGGMFLPAFSVFPISFNSIAMICLKVNLVRIVAASPLVISFAVLAAYKLDQPPVIGAVAAGKLLLILLCIQPLFVIFPISNTTNDTSSGRTWLKLLVLIPVLLALFGAAILIFLSSAPGVVLGCYALLMLLSVILFVVYRKAYRGGSFDLLTERSPRRA
jgi:hypothetical protein